MEEQLGKKLICAVDGSEQSDIAVALATDMAKAMDGELILLAVNELIGGVGRAGAATYMWENAELQKILNAAADLATLSGFAHPKTVSLKSRDVARAISMYAEEIGADHIVVGSGGKGAVARLMIGSVSRDVVFRAHCPVTVAR